MTVPVEVLSDRMDNFTDLAFVIQLALAFGGGIVAFVSPCVLPLVPGYLGLMSGYSVADLQAGDASRGRLVRVVGLFILGFSAVFVATGAAATQLGQVLNRNQTLTNRVSGSIVFLFGLVIVAMAFTNRGMFGFLSQERRMEVRPSKLGAWAPPVMGVAFGFGWTPCIGPILTGVLTLAATQETVFRGMVLLLAFSLGLGVPFLVVALGLRRAFRAMTRFRKWMRPVNIASGAVMAAVGVLLFTGNLSRIASFFVDVFLAIPLLDQLASI